MIATLLSTQKIFLALPLSLNLLDLMRHSWNNIISEKKIRTDPRSGKPWKECGMQSFE